MLKSIRERERFLRNEANWKLVCTQSEVHAKIYEMQLPNGVKLIRTVYDTWLDNNIIECPEYRMEHGKSISVPWRLCEVLDYLKTV